MPFSHADPEKDPIDGNFKPLHEADAKNQAMCTYNIMDRSVYTDFLLDDPALFKGAPVAVQIVGPRLGDAQLLRDTELIDTVLNAEA